MTQEHYLEYLRNIYLKKDGNPLSESSVQHYLEAMRYINEYFRIRKGDEFSIYEISDITELKNIRDELFNEPGFIKLNSDGHQMYSASMNRYFEFAEGSLFCGKKNLLYNLDKPELFKDIPTYVKEKKEKLISTHDRNRIKIIQSEMAYNYTCQINPDHKTFIVEGTSHQYMEGHHIIPLNRQQYFEYSLDCYANILVVCPTCHRFFHYAEKPKRVDKLKKIYDERAERLSNSGIKIDVKEFIELTNSKPSDTFYSYY